MLLAFQEVLSRSDMFAHLHVQREPLSVRQRMTDVLSALNASAFVDFVRLFRPDEGRRGVTVTFVAILELLREGLIEISPIGSLWTPARAARQSSAASETGGR